MSEEFPTVRFKTERITVNLSMSVEVANHEQVADLKKAIDQAQATLAVVGVPEVTYK